MGIVNLGVRTDFKRFKQQLCKLFEDKNSCQKEGNRLGITAYNMAIELLPYADPKKNYIEKKRNGCLLSIKSNSNGRLPFGSLPRLLFFLILNEIRLTKSPVLRLGKIYSNLLRISRLSQFLNIQNDKKNLYDQMLRLFSSQISFTYEDKSKAIKFNFWWNPLKGRKENFTASSTIVLTKEIFDQLINFNNIDEIEGYLCFAKNAQDTHYLKKNKVEKPCK